MKLSTACAGAIPPPPTPPHEGEGGIDVAASSEFVDGRLAGAAPEIPVPLVGRGQGWVCNLGSAYSGPSRETASPDTPPRAGFAIVAEQPSDAGRREALLDRAMGPRWKKKSSQKLRRGRRPSPGLAFVARSADGRVAGTVRLWDVRAGRGGPAALLLGPLAVDPALKGSGLGTVLMRHALDEARRLGHRAVLLVGDEPYYGRFGFSAEKTAALSMPGPYERHRFLAKELIAGALDGAAGTLESTGRPLGTGSGTRAA